MAEKLLTTVCVCVCVWVSVCIAPKSPHPKRTIIRPPDRFDDAESVAHIQYVYTNTRIVFSSSDRVRTDMVENGLQLLNLPPISLSHFMVESNQQQY